jgi:Phosphotransferase enzyme family
MPTILDTDNIFEYLASLNYCSVADKATSKITIIPAKNFNLLIALANGTHLLVKQELHNNQGETKSEFWLSWRIQLLAQEFADFSSRISMFLPNLLHFDPDSSILIVEYLNNYSDLADYYAKNNQFPIEIARSIGQLLATVHSQTFQQPEYHRFLDQQIATMPVSNNIEKSNPAIDIINRLSRITPHIFQVMPVDCLQFFKLYQRFPSLSQAIFDLGNAISPSCLAHNDLKINNILLDLEWQSPTSQIIKLIDWERADWGDPAFDLGCLISSYLEIWLNGLVISRTLSVNESLQLATTPLELIQPALFTIVQSYLAEFPAIITARPDYLDRVIQFAGLSLIQRIEIMIDENRIFDNRGMVILQVAKQLICTPQAAMNTLFGSNHTQLIAK